MTDAQIAALVDYIDAAVELEMAEHEDALHYEGEAGNPTDERVHKALALEALVAALKGPG